MKSLITSFRLCPLLVLGLSAGVFAAAPPLRVDMAGLVKQAAAYRAGQSAEPLRQFEELVRQSVSDPAVRRQVEAGLVQLLAPSANYEARRFACVQLGIIGSKTALPALALLLNSDETSGLACLALTSYPPGPADTILRDAIPFASGASRLQIITTLGDRRDSRSVDVLARIAREPDRRAAEAAIAALGKIGNQASRKALAALRQEPAPALEPALTEAALRSAEFLDAARNRKAAIAAYEDLLANASAPHVRRSALEALLRLDPNRREERIVAALHDMDSALKPVAIAAIRTLPTEVNSQVFAAELHKLSPAEQILMIDSLTTRSDIHAALAISVRITDPNTDVRLAAINAVGRFGDAFYVPMLTRALDAAKNPAESRVVESALVSLRGGAKTDRALTEEVKRCSGQARAGLIGVIAKRVGPPANSLFFVETENSDTAVVKAAFRALGKTAAAEDAPALVAALAKLKDRDAQPEAESATAQVLAKVEAASARSSMVRSALAGTNAAADGSASLLTLLPACADAPGLAAIQSALNDPDARIRDAAIHALSDWPDPAVWNTVICYYLQTTNASARGLALRGLVRLCGEQNAHIDATLVDHYRQLLAGAHTPAEFKVILGSLGAAFHPDTLQFARVLLSKPEVRPEAEVAVKRIAEAIKAQHPQAAEEALRQVQSLK